MGMTRLMNITVFKEERGVKKEIEVLSRNIYFSTIKEVFHIFFQRIVLLKDLELWV